MTERQKREARKAVIVLDLLGEEITPENIEAWLASGDQGKPTLPQCPRCGVKTDTLYPMEQVNGEWREVLQPDTLSDEILNKLERFCYRCCNELEGAE